MEGVSILIDDKQQIFTDSNGEYEVIITKPNTDIIASKDGYEFSNVLQYTPKITPPFNEIPKLDDINVKSVKLCGNILFDRLSESVKQKVTLYPRYFIYDLELLIL